MIELQDIFDIKYGTKLDLNKLELDVDGINFVSRTSKNNGVSAKVTRKPDIKPMPSGAISVSLGGTKLLSSFVHDEEFYTAQNVAVLIPKESMSINEKLFVCLCIEHNRFRYSAFGREANRTIKSIKIPPLDQAPAWVKSTKIDKYIGVKKSHSKANISIKSVSEWKNFRYDQIFDIERGRGPRRKELDGTGSTPFVTSSDKNNGLTGFTSQAAIHSGNTIGVNRNGSVAEAFYQPVPFCSTEDVHIFLPKFELNKYISMFLVTLIKKEKYRYNYGRKWGIERMKKSIIKLPVDKHGIPDWSYMESYIKTLAYSGKI